MTFCHISAITEHIYLKLWIYVHYQKSNQYYLNAFFCQNYAHFLDLDFFITINHSTAERLYPHVVLLF